MSRTKKEDIPQWAKAGHKRPVTRREFLAHGLIPFAAATFMPNWTRLLSPQAALADTSCPVGGSSLIPFFQLNLEGGASMSSQVVPMDAGRQLLPSYDIIGLGASSTLPITRVFGNAPFAGGGISNVLVGIQSVASTATQNNTSFIGYCVQGRDDSRENMLGAAGLVYASGLVGTKLPSMGNRDTTTGINQSPATLAPPSPLIVKSYNDIANSLGYTASLASLNQTQKEKLTKLIGDLNNSQSRKLASISNGAQLQDLINCAGIKNTQLIQEGTTAVDPRTNPSVASIWGLTSSTNPNTESFVLGAMIYNTLAGQAGFGSFSKGGYDYHGNDRATVTNVSDKAAGTIIGKILETARVLNKPLYLMVTTDGGVSATKSDSPTSNFNSDRGSSSMIHTYLYNPTSRPATTDFQVGQFTSGQAVDTGFFIGGNAELATHAVVLNWLKMNNRMDLYQQIVPMGRGLDSSQIAQVVKVA